MPVSRRPTRNTHSTQSAHTGPLQGFDKSSSFAAPCQVA